jgi:formate hydrogenlyase subunit 4
MAGILWAAAATIYWLEAGSLSQTGDIVVGVIFAGLALFCLARGLVGSSFSEDQAPSCRWARGW